jgi:hypothetical protein
LTFSEKVYYNDHMPRPRKEARLRMDADLRIPVTGEQKALIEKATADEPQGMAAWARSVLLDAAKRKVARARNGAAGAASGGQHTQ